MLFSKPWLLSKQTYSVSASKKKFISSQINGGTVHILPQKNRKGLRNMNDHIIGLTVTYTTNLISNMEAVLPY